MIQLNRAPGRRNNPAGSSTRVEVQMEDEFEPYIAVPLQGAEEEMLQEEYAVSLEFRFRTGFPPRYFLRLDPAESGSRS